MDGQACGNRRAGEREPNTSFWFRIFGFFFRQGARSAEFQRYNTAQNTNISFQDTCASFCLRFFFVCLSPGLTRSICFWTVCFFVWFFPLAAGVFLCSLLFCARILFHLLHCLKVFEKSSSIRRVWLCLCDLSFRRFPPPEHSLASLPGIEKSLIMYRTARAYKPGADPYNHRHYWLDRSVGPLRSKVKSKI